MDSGLPLTQKGYKMATLEKAPTSNFWSTSLNGAINDSVTTITLNSTVGLQAPGRLVINRQDSTGKNTPSAREVISFTGISGSDLTGVTRGADNSTARSHADGSLVESAIVVGNWDALYKVIDQEHNADGTHDTSKVAGVDGWINPDETWTYASATTITVPSGATAKYQKGDKIKLTQTTVKYFYIVGVADTLLTITGGNDYTLTSATITDNYYSKVENPQGFPDWFGYSTTPGGFSGTPAQRCSFAIIGKTCHAYIRISGTSNAVSLTATLPVANSVNANLYFPVGRATDNGTPITATAPAAVVTASSTTITFYKSWMALDWTASGTKELDFQITYEI